MIALVIAMFSDAIDGFLARRYGAVSRAGTFIDPCADKFFVFFILAVFLQEDKLLPWEAITMLCRDISVIIFGIYLACKGTLGQYQFRAIFCGKLMTALQFVVLIGLTSGITFPPFVYFIFISIGFCALIELYIERKKLKVT